MGANPYDINAVVYLMNANDQVLAGLSAELEPDTEWLNWIFQFTNIPEVAVRYKITWNIRRGMGYEWAPESPITGDINWETAEIFEPTWVVVPE